MDELSYNDITQQYNSNLVSYKGTIVYVQRVLEDSRVKLMSLATKAVTTVPFRLSDFSVIKSRLGMVNVCDSVMYVSRLPVRRMGIGINASNINIEALPIDYPQGREDTRHTVKTLICDGILQALTNNYLPFKEAVSKVKDEKPLVLAFDRQFAVSSGGMIYYKTRVVGVVDLNNNPSVSNIMFGADYKHLSLLLENNHEKTIGYSCP